MKKWISSLLASAGLFLLSCTENNTELYDFCQPTESRCLRSVESAEYLSDARSQARIIDDFSFWGYHSSYFTGMYRNLESDCPEVAATSGVWELSDTIIGIEISNMEIYEGSCIAPFSWYDEHGLEDPLYVVCFYDFQKDPEVEGYKHISMRTMTCEPPSYIEGIVFSMETSVSFEEESLVMEKDEILWLD